MSQVISGFFSNFGQTLGGKFTTYNNKKCNPDDNDSSLCGKTCKYENFDNNEYIKCKKINEVKNSFNEFVNYFNSNTPKDDINNICNTIQTNIDEYLSIFDKLLIEKNVTFSNNIKLCLIMLRETFKKINEIYNTQDFSHTNFYRSYLKYNKEFITHVLNGLTSKINHKTKGNLLEISKLSLENIKLINSIYKYNNNISDYIKIVDNTEYSFNELNNYCEKSKYKEYTDFLSKQGYSKNKPTADSVINNVFLYKSVPLNDCNTSVLSYEYLDKYIDAFKKIDNLKSQPQEPQLQQEPQPQQRQLQQEPQLQPQQELPKNTYTININNFYSLISKKRNELISNIEKYNKIATLYDNLNENINDINVQHTIILNYIKENNELINYLKNNCTAINTCNILNLINDFEFNQNNK